jgi:DNA-binding PadR family transcriptional regulator
MPKSLSNTSVAILQALAGGVRYGFDIIDATGLPSGTVYPALAKLEDAGLVSSRWENPRIAQQEKRPPRRYYELRPSGEAALKEALRSLRVLQKPITGRLRAVRFRS